MHHNLSLVLKRFYWEFLYPQSICKSPIINLGLSSFCISYESSAYDEPSSWTLIARIQIDGYASSRPIAKTIYPCIPTIVRKTLSLVRHLSSLRVSNPDIRLWLMLRLDNRCDRPIRFSNDYSTGFEKKNIVDISIRLKFPSFLFFLLSFFLLSPISTIIETGEYWRVLILVQKHFAVKDVQANVDRAYPNNRYVHAIVNIYIRVYIAQFSIYFQLGVNGVSLPSRANEAICKCFFFRAINPPQFYALSCSTLLFIQVLFVVGLSLSLSFGA